MAAEGFFLLYVNLLSKDTRFRWDKIVTSQVGSAPWTNLQGNQQESFFTKGLVEPLPDYGIDTHIEHESGERAPLCNAPSSAKHLPVIAPSPACQFYCLPEMLLES